MSPSQDTLTRKRVLDETYAKLTEGFDDSNPDSEPMESGRYARERLEGALVQLLVDVRRYCRQNTLNMPRQLYTELCKVEKELDLLDSAILSICRWDKKVSVAEDLHYATALNMVTTSNDDEWWNGTLDQLEKTLTKLQGLKASMESDLAKVAYVSHLWNQFQRDPAALVQPDRSMMRVATCLQGLQALEKQEGDGSSSEE